MKGQAKKQNADHSVDKGPVTHYVVGKGISERPMVSLDFTRPGLTVEDLERVLPKGTYTFEGRIAFAEKWAKKTIEADGPPTDRSEERVTDRWYAAEILSELHLVRTLIERGETAHAAHRALDLGMLLRELHDVMLYNTATICGDKILRAVRGPRSPRRHPVLMNFLKTCRYRNKKLTAGELFEQLKKYDDEAPLKVHGGEIVCLRGKLKIYSGPHGDRTFSRKKFYEYFRACKNPPTRAQ
ncbi:MAG: hypothetical protein A2Z40_03630 [Deltaproteobacteria bacterium RBG_19FT_COMBO_60_16]|nr:MAG: hypothetical protein A2Z40_03630 [Deltaproteobacteria bacterium RBG_19FT_COMBO_60_16]